MKINFWQIWFKKIGKFLLILTKDKQKKHRQSRSSHVYNCHISSALVKPCILLSTLTVVPKGHFVRKKFKTWDLYQSILFKSEYYFFILLFKCGFFLHPILKFWQSTPHWFCQILSCVRHRNKNFSTFTTKRDMNSHKIWMM